MVPKYRGKTIKGLLVVGYVSVVTDKRAGVEPGTYISNSVGFPFAYEVDPKTVGQSTGLKDKNGVEIFEGDIVSVRNHPFQKTEKSGAGIEIDGDYAISWNEGDLTWCAGNLLLARLKPYVTVAGNIYENPNLLEQANA
ncbi:YopX family protein [Enterococcus gallinarum]|uniref:YopX family protein n=1 Tax=Enterococcus gallinarum TaxID=1353 RepID=UPI003D369FB5